jgi:preprotein translocase subunit SecF
MLQLIRNDLNIPFIRWRWIGFAVSAVLMLLGATAVVQIARGHARLGVDFAGGTAMEVEFAKPITAEELRKAVKDPAFADVTLQNINEAGRYKYLLHILAPTLQTSEVSTQARDVIAKNVAGNPVTVLSSEDVGPSVSSHLRQQTFMAIFWALVGILIYIWWRFDFRFSVAATVATVHDVLAVLGIFFLLDREINLLLVTALLTIAGYSLNDTVVIFDRIRENLRLNRKTDYNIVINNSINETLSRTIITSLATLFVVGALVFLGGEVIFTFSLAMLFGLVVGCYSTIFVASNLLAEWHVRAPQPR